MSITCTGYVVSPSNNWLEKGDGSAGLKSASQMHAERVAWNKLPASTAYLLVQNAYPCKHCHDFFKGESLNNHSIVIKVEANEGSYSSDHFTNQNGTPILKGSVPCVIYYHNGVASYVTITDVMAGRTSGPPTGFPAIPPIL